MFQNEVMVICFVRTTCAESLALSTRGFLRFTSPLGCSCAVSCDGAGCGLEGLWAPELTGPIDSTRDSTERLQ